MKTSGDLSQETLPSMQPPNVFQQAYRAGENGQPFYSKRGISRVDIDPEGVYVEAGDGTNCAQVMLPTQKYHGTAKQKRPLFKRKATWLIILLVVLIIGGIAVGVAVHEINTDDDDDQSTSSVAS